MRELFRHGRLVAAPNLGEAREPRPYHEPLPVRRQLPSEFFEEARADRARADEAHVADEDVPELRDLVELRGAKPVAKSRGFGLRAPHELLAEERSESLLGAAP